MRGQSHWAWGVAMGAILVASGPGSRVEAQLSAGSMSAQAIETFTYREGTRTLVVTRDPDGALWLVANGRRFRTAIGTDRVIVVGARTESELVGLDVVLAEVLSPEVGIVAVRSARTGEGPLALAQRLAEFVRSGRLEGASPDLAFEHIRADIAVPPDDPSLDEQWFFEAIGIEAAWAREDGDPSVTIAIVDNGCDLRHRDLAPHMLPGYDALDAEHEPAFSPGGPGNEHGTACAGLAAAVTDNGLDVSGACPECSIRCVRLLDGPSTLVPMSAEVRAFEFIVSHDDIAVVSNSWGFGPGFPVPFALERLIERVLTGGRGGRGALVVFASGNSDAVIGSDELQAIPGVIAVGALEPSGERASYSNSGRCLAVVSPTGTVSTDITGSDGAGPGTVTRSFSGTSSACPIVAGVLGLMVSAAPALRGEALRDALVSSARRSPFARPDARGHDPYYGYGVVDPTAALAEVLPDLDAGVPDDLDASTEMPDARLVPRDVGPIVRTPRGCGCRAATSRSVPLERGWLAVVAFFGIAARVRCRLQRTIRLSCVGARATASSGSS